MNKVDEVVGFLSSAPNRKSNSRLTVFICVLICLMAAIAETYCRISSTIAGRNDYADWTGVTMLVFALLFGNAALKYAQTNKAKVEKDVSTEL